MTNDERDAILETMRDSLGQLTTSIARIEEGCKPCRSMIHEYHLALDGENGTPGHKARLAVVESKISEIAKSLSDAWDELTWTRRGLIGVMLGVIGAVVGVILPRIL